MSNRTEKPTEDQQAVATDSQSDADIPTGEPVPSRPDKRYSVRAILFYTEEGQDVREIDNALSLLFSLVKASAHERWNGLPGRGLQEVERAYFEGFIGRMMALGESLNPPLPVPGGTDGKAGGQTP